MIRQVPPPYLIAIPPAIAVWLWFALSNNGIVWPDEIFQSLEQAHRLAFGYGFVPWEFQVGARSWAFPAVLAGVFKLGQKMGIETGEGLVVTSKVFMVALGAVGLVATARLARALAADRAALLAVVLAATFPANILYAGRCVSEVPSAVLLAFAAERAMGSGNRRLRTAGVLAGLAAVLRGQNWLVAAGLAVWMIGCGRRTEARRYLEGLGMALGLGAALDWLTWGAPYHSLLTYFRYNVQHSADYGTTSPLLYVLALWRTTGPVLLFLAAGFIHEARRRPGLAVVVIGYVIVHALVPHKELRFLLPVAPIAIAISAAGLDDLVARIGERFRLLPKAALTGVSACALGLGEAARAPGLSFADIGMAASSPGAAESVWHRAESTNRLIFVAGSRADACGLAVVGPSVVWLGGYTYLHRDVPFFDVAPAAIEAAWPPERFGANYIIAPGTLPVPRSSEIAASGGLTLLRLDGPCGPPPPQYSRRLPLPPGVAPR